MRLVHSISLYDEKEGKDKIIDRISMSLNNFTVEQDIRNLLNTELNKDFMSKVTKIYLKYGIEVANAYAKYKYSNKELTQKEKELLKEYNFLED